MIKPTGSAGHRRRRWFARSLKFTREGKVYVAVTLGVGFGAVNTGNNLLFLVLGMMLGMIIVSGILSELTLRGVSVVRTAPLRVEAGTIFPVELALQNDKDYAASFSVELRDEIDGQPFKRRCFFLRVAAGQRRSIAYRCEMHKRGRASYTGTIVSTRFPFGLFEKSRFMDQTQEVIVLPSTIPIGRMGGMDRMGDEGGALDKRGHGTEYHELRVMTQGDDPRRIHWPATARAGEPMIRETLEDSTRHAEIVLDAASGNEPASIGWAEQRIRAAASVVRRLTGEGYKVRLVTGAGTCEADGNAGLGDLLEHLALLDTAALHDALPPRGSSGAAILIGPGAGGSPGSRSLDVPPPPVEVAP